MRIPRLLLLLSLVWSLAPLLRGSDADAAKAYEKGLAQFKAREYYAALKSFKDSELLADSNTVRANSVRAQIGAARMCELPWREFEAIETLFNRFPEYAEAGALVDREFELGDLYYRGKREPAFYAVRGIPWLEGADKTAEIYRAALKRAPFAKQAPAARLRLALLYDRAGELHKSIAELRIVLEKFPESKAARWALLALAHACYELAEHGDGDGRYAREANLRYEQFLKKYPGAPETPAVKANLQRIRDARAQRLWEMAEFYRRNGRTEAAERYLARAVRDFPDAGITPQAEAELAALDRSFTPGDFPADGSARLVRYPARALPSEAERVLIAPGENSEFLLPVPDLSAYTGKKETKR